MISQSSNYEILALYVSMHKKTVVLNKNSDVKKYDMPKVTVTVTVQGEHACFAESFVCLGCAINSGGKSFLVVNRCLGIASIAVNSLYRSV